MLYLKPVIKRLMQKRLGEILAGLGFITEKQLQEALDIQNATGQRLGEILIERGFVTKSQLVQAVLLQEGSIPDFGTDEELAVYLEERGIEKKKLIKAVEAYYGISYIELENVRVNPDVLSIFDLKSLKNLGMLPYALDKDAKTVYFAVSDLGDTGLRDTVAALCAEKGFNVRFSFAFSGAIEKKFKELLENRSQNSAPVIIEGGAAEWVEEVIRRGISMRASDIHIEPLERGIQVRFRIDGVLASKNIYPELTDSFVQSIIARVKIQAGMDIAEKRKPQDGRMDNFELGEIKYDLRISTVPTINGEKIVMRIFEKNTRIQNFNELGFSTDDERKIRKMLNSPHGIIYLAGATGSGKTTTLYAMIDSINSDEINIYSLEDPVEKTIPGVNQVQINPQAGVTYPSMLRALLRQDPDVIVVGEVRDAETAELSVRSSLTGHLVLATIHANTALDTVNRLFNMGIEPYLLAATAQGFISQRLIRKLCPFCREKTPLSAAEKEWIKEIEAKFNVSFAGTDFYSACGCPKCGNVGYTGRTAVAEIIPVDDEILRSLISERDTEALYAELLKRGFKPLELAACLKAAEGVTSVGEVLRVL